MGDPVLADLEAVADGAMAGRLLLEDRRPDLVTSKGLFPPEVDDVAGARGTEAMLGGGQPREGGGEQ